MLSLTVACYFHSTPINKSVQCINLGSGRSWFLVILCRYLISQLNMSNNYSMGLCKQFRKISKEFITLKSKNNHVLFLIKYWISLKKLITIESVLINAWFRFWIMYNDNTSSTKLNHVLALLLIKYVNNSNWGTNNRQLNYLRNLLINNWWLTSHMMSIKYLINNSRLNTIKSLLNKIPKSRCQTLPNEWCDRYNNIMQK